MTLKNWLPLIGLTCAAFIFNTSEFIPIGLLSDIAADFDITGAHAGMLISVYAWIVMLLSLPLMMLVSKMELRKLMLYVMALFVLFQLLSSMSSGYTMLMLSRIGVACTHAVFWSIVAPLAVRIVPDNHRPLALSMIVTGTSVAMIFGLPIGRVIGLSIGWRMTFLCVGVFALLTAVYLATCLPKVQSGGRFSWHRLPELFKNPLLVGLYILTFVAVTAHYMGYSYIEPFLDQVAGLTSDWVTATLMIFGGVGILGSVLFSKFYAKKTILFIDAVILGIAACLLLLHPSAHFAFTVVVLCALWGVAITAFNAALQAEIIRDSPQNATSISMSIYSGIYNLGIGCGSFAGGSICTYLSISEIGYAGGVIALVAFLFWRKRVLGRLKKALGDDAGI